MSEQYTPTSGEVRDALEAWMWASRPYRPELKSADPGEALDRLLAQVRREAKAEGIREAADEWHAEHTGTRPGPYVWLWAYADQLEQEGKNDE